MYTSFQKNLHITVPHGNCSCIYYKIRDILESGNLSIRKLFFPDSKIFFFRILKFFFRILKFFFKILKFIFDSNLREI